MRIEHRFQLAHKSLAGVCCDESGLSVGGAPLFVRACLTGSGQAWLALPAEEINKALGEVYGLRVDVTSKVGGLAGVARALDDGEVARAQILALHLRFPDPPDLSKAAGDHRLFDELVLRLKASDLLKADWDSAKHPRWPADSPDSVGGQFAPVGSAGDGTAETSETTDHIVAQFRDGPPKLIPFADRTDAELSDGVYRHPVGGTGDVAEFDTATGVFGPPSLPKFKPDLIGDLVEIAAHNADKQAIGNAGEAAAEKVILENGYDILGDQVQVRDQFGQLRIIDFLISKKGNPRLLGSIEVKANGGRRNARQRVIDYNIEVSGGTIVSRTELFGGLKYGDKIRPHTTVMEVKVFRPQRTWSRRQHRL